MLVNYVSHVLSSLHRFRWHNLKWCDTGIFLWKSPLYSLTHLSSLRPISLAILLHLLSAQSVLTMVFQVGCSSEERFPEKVSMIFEAMAGKSTVVNPVYPHNLTKEGQERHCRPLLDLKSMNLSQLWLGVRDENKDKIIGVSQWNVYDRYKPPETQLDGPDDIWDTPADKEWAKALFRALMEYWRKVVREATQPIIRKFTLFRYRCRADSDFGDRPQYHGSCSKTSIPRSWLSSHKMGHGLCRCDRRRRGVFTGRTPNGIHFVVTF